MSKYQNALNSVTWRLTSYEEDLELRPTAKEDIATLQELVDLANVLEEYNVTPQNIRAVLMVGQMFIDKETNKLEQLEKLKAAIKILKKYFTVSEEQLNKIFLIYANFPDYTYISKEHYELLKEVLND